MWGLPSARATFLWVCEFVFGSIPGSISWGWSVIVSVWHGVCRISRETRNHAKDIVCSVESELSFVTSFAM